MSDWAKIDDDPTLDEWARREAESLRAALTDEQCRYAAEMLSPFTEGKAEIDAIRAEVAQVHAEMGVNERFGGDLIAAVNAFLDDRDEWPVYHHEEREHRLAQRRKRYREARRRDAELRERERY